MSYFQATFEDKFEYNGRFTKYRFELKNPHRFDFKAGQFVKIKISEGFDQEYFIFSSPDVDHGFEVLVDFGINEVGGTSLNFFKNLQFGQEIDFIGPLGDFVIDPSGNSELILIATGVGVAPLYSMILDLLQVQGSKRGLTLFWGLNNLGELFLEDDLGELTQDFPNFKFHPVIANALPEWSLCRGTVLDCLMVHEVNADADFYICTVGELGEKIKNLCLTNTVKDSQLHMAKYA